MIALLTVARDAQARGDLAGTLEALLAAWRELPATILAEAIEAVGARAAHDVPVPATEGEWLALAVAGDPVVRGKLCAIVREGPPLPRFRALFKHRDPRVARALVDHLKNRTTPSQTRFASEKKPLFHGLIGLGDPRVVADLDSLFAVWDAKVWHGPEGRKVFRSVTALLAEIREALPPTPPELEPADVVIATEIAMRARASVADEEHRGAALLAAVYADPASDGPRAVYADWLQQRGDPRGEYLALALSGTESSRAAELLRTYERTWLGSLEPHVSTVNASWRRGFPAKLRVDSDEPPADPGWATLETVEKRIPPAVGMPVLRKATELGLADLLRLASHAIPPPLEYLEVDTFAFQPELHDAAVAAFEAIRLPRLHHFMLRVGAWGEGKQPRLAATELPRILAIGPFETFWTSIPLDDLASWILAATATRLTSITLEQTYLSSQLTITRDAAGVMSQIKIDRGIDAEAFCDAVDQLPENWLTSMGIHPKGYPKAVRQRIVASLARHPRCR